MQTLSMEEFKILLQGFVAGLPVGALLLLGYFWLLEKFERRGGGSHGTHN